MKTIRRIVRFLIAYQERTSPVLRIARRISYDEFIRRCRENDNK